MTTYHFIVQTSKQCCGSGFILVGWTRLRIGNTDLDPDPGGPKLHTKVKKIQVLKCSLLTEEYFSCSLDVRYGGLGISKFLIKKIKFFSCKFFLVFSPWIWIRIRVLIETKADPQHCQ